MSARVYAIVPERCLYRAGTNSVHVVTARKECAHVPPVSGADNNNMEVHLMKRLVIAIALAATLPFAASAADGISYNSVKGGYVATNTDGGNADGWGLGGSVAGHPNFHLFADYANQKIDHTSVDFDQWRVGAGYNRGISQRTDFVGTLAYEKLDAGAGINAEGYSVEAGLRSALTPNIEGYAMVGYQDGHDFEGDAYGRLGTNVKFNQNWGINADVRLVKGGDTQWFVGPRFTW